MTEVPSDRLSRLLSLPRTLVSDGALGTELQARGLPAGAPPETWNEERPAVVLAVHRSYARAGSDLLLTNSFGGNPVRLAKCGLESKSRELSRLAGALCRQAAGERPVLGSIGPTGALLAPLGDLSARRAQDAFALQAAALAEGGADGILLETFFDLQELELALAAALEHTELPVGCCMSFQPSGRTIMGVSAEGFAERIGSWKSDRVLFLGANCSVGPEEMETVCARLRRSSDLPVWVKPNAGKPRLAEGHTVYPADPEAFARCAATWADAGAKVVGGCCGTTPAHIKRIAEVLRQR